ncbi:MAG: glycosyltransferase family 2 protein [Hyphomonadaceae bacterium]
MDKFPSRERSTSATLNWRVSAVVVVANVRPTAAGRTSLDLCLRSAMAEPWIDDLVVVDHGNVPEISSILRGVQADRRDVRLITAPRGATSAAAANLGAEAARGRWLLFLDPDVVLQRGSVARMAAAGGGARTPWIVGGKLTDTQGRERAAARVGALNSFSALAVAMEWRGPKPKRKGAKAPAKVAAVSSAFMLVPRGDFEALGRFDEGFATDAADLDLCRRAADAGGSVLFQPAASGVQFERGPRDGRRQAQGLALFAAKSAKTLPEKAFAAIARPALMALLGLKDFVCGRPPIRR